LNSQTAKRREYAWLRASLLRNPDAWRFCGYYCITFGGFVGLASFLSLFFHEQYELSRITAGTLTAACVFSGSMLRPVGGFLADRLGGTRILLAVFAAVAVTIGGASLLPSLEFALALMVTAMGLLGLGNGVVFQLIPQRFSREIGLVTGIVGAVGGLGGFLLPSLLGLAKQWTGSFAPGLAGFALTALSAGAAVLLSQAAEIRPQAAEALDSSP
jgi:NNP family nitrate/nitrite transporter-like MFS transporter